MGYLLVDKQPGECYQTSINENVKGEMYMEQTLSREAVLNALIERTPKSGQLWKDAQDVIPGGLLSVARKFKPYPFFTDHSQGAYTWDVDGNRYIDCCMNYGTQLLGHLPEVVIRAVEEQLKRGTVYGTPHPLEIEYAEKFLECVPCAERMLLCNSGTEATMQGARIMRAFTGKDKVGKFEGGYHGWHDYAMWNVYLDPDTMGPVERPNLVPSSAGIPKPVADTMLALPFDEAAFDLIEEYADEMAGVMIEPVVGTGAIPMNTAFLQGLREVTSKHGILLMFDEVKTGFRLALGGAQEFFGVIPDLATYGKIAGGGLPIGAVGCTKEISDAVTKYEFSISVAGTFSGNPVTLAAGNAMLGYLMENPQVYTELARKGDRLRDGFNDYARQRGLPACLTGVGSFFQSHLTEGPVTSPRDMLHYSMDAIYDLQLFLRLNGVFVPWFHDAFLSAAHSNEDVEDVLRIHQESVEAALGLNGLIP
jgi:glutamate-1-semialdehyde 2,1-aminomutase